MKGNKMVESYRPKPKDKFIAKQQLNSIPAYFAPFTCTKKTFNCCEAKDSQGNERKFAYSTWEFEKYT